jgi:hypothetical protein
MLLGMDITGGPIVHHLPDGKRRVLKEGQVDAFTGISGDVAWIVLPDFRPVAGSEITDGEEREIVIVWYLIGEQVLLSLAAGGGRNPHVRAD